MLSMDEVPRLGSFWGGVRGKAGRIKAVMMRPKAATRVTNELTYSQHERAMRKRLSKETHHQSLLCNTDG
jgi:hypothetical protein